MVRVDDAGLVMASMARSQDAGVEGPAWCIGAVVAWPERIAGLHGHSLTNQGQVMGLPLEVAGDCSQVRSCGSGLVFVVLP
jgi:hypothetical protein